MEKLQNKPTDEQCRNILTLLYTLWANQNGLEIVDINITKKAEEESA